MNRESRVRGRTRTPVLCKWKGVAVSTPHKANRNTAIKTTGRTLVGVGVTGAVALTGAGFGQAQPHIDNQRENSGPDTDLDLSLIHI